MFQWPKLPELVLSVGDYSALKDNFTADPVVIINYDNEKLNHIPSSYSLNVPQ